MKIQDLTPPVAVPEPAWKQQLVEFWQQADDHHKIDLEVTLKMGDAAGARKIIESWQQEVIERRKKKKSRPAKKKKSRVRYGYGGYWTPGFNFGSTELGGEGGGDGGGGGESVREASTPDGVSASTKMFLEQDADSVADVIQDFVSYCVDELGISQAPRLQLRRDPVWSQRNRSFGQFDPGTNRLDISTADRHVMDILRTVAHELVHHHQQEQKDLPADAGETGSKYENEANARAGELMRGYGRSHPELFGADAVSESSGYIPTRAEKNDPRFKMALSPDVRPGATGKNANKMALKTGPQGEPQLLIKGLKNALREFKESGSLPLTKEQDLFEIDMSPSNLRKLAAQTGALAGMEFEMIVPDVGSSDVEPEYEPDYEQDERTRSFSDIRVFFHDGDYNSRRDVDRLMEELGGEYEDWQQEKTAEAWDGDSLEFMTDYISLNDLFDRDEAMLTARDEVIDANPDLPQESEDFSQLLSARLDEMEREFAARELEDQGRIYDAAFEAFAEEQRDEYNEDSFLDDKYPYMSSIQDNFDISWPHYIDINADSEGEGDIDQVADEFSNYMGKPVNASRSYHGGRREAGTYVVEPDGSLDGDNPGDEGLEFVSPPMPIDEMISDLNKVKAWAAKQGCYTNDSTGLHINISVPNYTLAKLDYVKLALLMGDEYVLELFGRSGNTYAKSATGKIKTMLQRNPDVAPQIMNKMREHMADLATKAIHSGTTDKYTSINTKTGYIEFRSPGGDWLGENFSKIENTLLRFTVALSAAIDPEAYRQEYLKKLYKLLESSQEKGGPNVLQLFANYSAGELDKAALIRQVREKQLARNLSKGKLPAGQKYWWNVEWTNGRRMEVVAGSKQVALQVAAEEWEVLDSELADAKVTPLRPYQEPAAQPTQSGNWGVWVPSLDRFAAADNDTRRFADQAGAQAWINDYNQRNAGNELNLQPSKITNTFRAFDVGNSNTVGTFQASGPAGSRAANVAFSQYMQSLGRTNTAGFDYDEAEPLPDIFPDIPQQPAAAGTAADALPEVPLDIEIERAPRTLTTPGQPQQTFSGEWKIVDADGQELHRFGGVGNAQADANATAIRWLQQNPRLMQAGVEVVPVMSE